MKDLKRFLALLMVMTLVFTFSPLVMAEEADVDETEQVENGETEPDEEDEEVEEPAEEPEEETEEEPAEETEEVEDNPSEWAVPEIDAAIEKGLVTEKVLSNYQEDITREDFCELVVKLYEALSGEEAELPEENVFTDTENEEVLKANALEIVLGVSDTEFAPDANITREAIAVMFYRALEKVDPALVEGEYEVAFADIDQISEWALEAIGFMSDNEIISGVGENMVDPQGNATREQAIALVVRTFDIFQAEEEPVEEELDEDDEAEPVEEELDEDDEAEAEEVEDEEETTEEE